MSCILNLIKIPSNRSGYKATTNVIEETMPAVSRTAMPVVV